MGPSSFNELGERNLGGIGLFCSVDSEALLKLGHRARWWSVRSGHALIRKGDVSTTFLALVRGSAQLHEYGSGRVDEIDAGAVIGLIQAFSGQPSTMHVVATTSALVAEISRSDLLAAMTETPRLTQNLALFLHGRGGAAGEARARLDARVAAALVRAAAERPSGGRFARLPGPVQLSVWATLLGVDTVDVRRSLTRLEGAGLIRSEGARRVSVDLVGLRRRLG